MTEVYALIITYTEGYLPELYIYDTEEKCRNRLKEYLLEQVREYLTETDRLDKEMIPYVTIKGCSNYTLNPVSEPFPFKLFERIAREVFEFEYEIRKERVL